ncbi:MAG TPA: MarR family transcriptional regulator [Verrucomicrobiae bacterium]|jgi:DNA-binding MarR family transcriptional regulator
MAKPDLKQSHDLAMGLRMAYWALHRRTDESLAPRHLTANQFVLLALLMEEDGITQQDLVLRASSDPSTIRAMLVLLEKKGLVARSQHTRDGRALSVTLTHKGRRAYRQMWRVTQSVRQRLLVAFDARETAFLIELLARTADVMISPTVPKSFRKRIVNSKGDDTRTTCHDETTIPGCWECPQCGFTLRNELDIKSAMVGPNNEPLAKRCPNDGQRLKPETWKGRCGKLAASCDQLLVEIQWLNDFCAFAPHPKLHLPRFADGQLRQLAQAGLKAPIKCKKCGKINLGPSYKPRKTDLQPRVSLPPDRWLCKSCGEPLHIMRVKAPERLL